MNQESGQLPSREFLYESLGTSCLICSLLSVLIIAREDNWGMIGEKAASLTGSVTTPQLTVGLDSRAELLRPTLLLAQYCSNYLSRPDECISDRLTSIFLFLIEWRSPTTCSQAWFAGLHSTLSSINKWRCSVKQAACSR